MIQLFSGQWLFWLALAVVTVCLVARWWCRRRELDRILKLLEAVRKDNWQEGSHQAGGGYILSTRFVETGAGTAWPERWLIERIFRGTEYSESYRYTLRRNGVVVAGHGCCVNLHTNEILPDGDPRLALLFGDNHWEMMSPGSVGTMQN